VCSRGSGSTAAATGAQTAATEPGAKRSVTTHDAFRSNGHRSKTNRLGVVTDLGSGRVEHRVRDGARSQRGRRPRRTRTAIAYSWRVGSSVHASTSLSASCHTTPAARYVTVKVRAAFEVGGKCHTTRRRLSSRLISNWPAPFPRSIGTPSIDASMTVSPSVLLESNSR